VEDSDGAVTIVDEFHDTRVDPPSDVTQRAAGKRLVAPSKNATAVVGFLPAVRALGAERSMSADPLGS
jgi:hypothetical protein